MPSIDKIDLNLFIIFHEIYKESSVTKVASKLNITQPAVSNSLSRLRSHFDDPLFVKTPSGMQPTPTAEAVISDVRKALVLLEKSVGRSGEFDPLNTNKLLRLSMGDLAGTVLLSALQRQLEVEAPHVSVTNYYHDREASVSQLKSGNLDFLIDAPAFNAKEFDQEFLLESPYVVFMRADHPLSEKKMTLKNYLEYGHIHVSGRSSGAGQTDIALHSKGHRRDIKFRTASYLIAEKMTNSSDYLWTAPKAIVPNLNQGLVYAKPPIKIDPLRLNLYWKKSVTNDPCSSWFRAKISAVFKQFTF